MIGLLRSGSMMTFRSFGLSNVGRVRAHNEDSFLCDDELGLFVVCDGVGGMSKGEMASAESVDLVYAWVRREAAILEAFRTPPGDSDRTPIRRLIETAIQSACYMVFGMGQLEPEHKGMATTLSALLLAPGVAFVGQVGDSRVYRARDGRTEQLTEDHTLVNHEVKQGLLSPDEATRSKHRNIITRAVGLRDYVQVDVLESEARLGDRFLLCTDGLHGYLLPGEANSYMKGDGQEVVEKLVDLANRRGGKDNITAVVVDVMS